MDAPTWLAGHGEVVAQHTCHLFQAAGPLLLQTPGRPGVQLPALLAQQASVRRLLNEAVAEAVRGLCDLVQLYQQTGGAKFRECSREAAVEGGHRPQGIGAELRPENGRGDDSFTGANCETVDAGAKKAFQSLRNLPESVRSRCHFVSYFANTPVSSSDEKRSSTKSGLPSVPWHTAFRTSSAAPWPSRAPASSLSSSRGNADSSRRL